MKGLFEIGGESFVAGTSKCYGRVKSTSGRPKYCGKRVKYVLPLWVIIEHVNRAEGLGCTDHAKWRELTEAGYQHVVHPSFGVSR